MPVANGANSYRLGTSQVNKVYLGASVVWANFVAPSGGDSVWVADGYEYRQFDGTGSLVVTSPVTVEYMIVGGGGATGYIRALGGGGGGGVSTGSTALGPGTYPVVVGAGGSQSATAGVKGTDGSSTTFLGITSYGGGAGGVTGSDVVTGSSGNNGASGGGGAPGYVAGSTAAGGTGIPGQGYAGGTGAVYDPWPESYGGGGGGAAGVGEDTTPNVLGYDAAGGLGVAWNGLNAPNGRGFGQGGGGGNSRTGSGPGGGNYPHTGAGGKPLAGNGDSGVVIVRYAI